MVFKNPLWVGTGTEGLVALHLLIGPLNATLAWIRYRDVNPVPNSQFADDLAIDAG